MSTNHANETRIRNWRAFRLRGTLAALSDARFQGGPLRPGIPDEFNADRWADRALDEARVQILAALQVHEAKQYLEARYRTYRLSLWQPGDHPDCPIRRLPDEVAVYGTMRLGDAWAQVVRCTDKSYARRFSFPTNASGSYRRPVEAQLSAAHRVLREDTRDPRTCPYPGDRWTGDPDESHLVVTLLHPVRVQILSPNGEDLTVSRLPSYVREAQRGRAERAVLMGEAYPSETIESVLWRVAYVQAPHTGPRIEGLPTEHIEVPFGPKWPFQIFGGATQGTTRHARVGAATLGGVP